MFIILVHSKNKSKVYSLNSNLPFSENIYLLELRFLQDMGEEATGHFVLKHPNLKKFKVNCNRGLDEFEVWGDDERAAFAKASTIFQHRYEKPPQQMEIKK